VVRLPEQTGSEHLSLLVESTQEVMSICSSVLQSQTGQTKIPSPATETCPHGRCIVMRMCGGLRKRAETGVL